jgi:hypothetical protein
MRRSRLPATGLKRTSALLEILTTETQITAIETDLDRANRLPAAMGDELDDSRSGRPACLGRGAHWADRIRNCADNLCGRTMFGVKRLVYSKCLAS